jgi:hypothetical protein
LNEEPLPTIACSTSPNFHLLMPLTNVFRRARVFWKQSIKAGMQGDYHFSSKKIMKINKNCIKMKLVQILWVFSKIWKSCVNVSLAKFGICGPGKFGKGRLDHFIYQHLFVHTTNDLAYMHLPILQNNSGSTIVKLAKNPKLENTSK